MMLSTSFRTAALVALTAAGVTLFAAAAVQQNYRQSGYDPQIQLAEDGAAALGRGEAPAQIAGDNHVNASSSLAPFVTVYDSDRNVLSSSGQFDGQTLSPPPGTFQAAKAGTGKDTSIRNENRFTWQTSTGVREAAVIVYQPGSHPGFVLAARSLREVENRTASLELMAVAALATIALVAGGYGFLVRK